MKALSIRQPWAWLICMGYKDIENRDWATKFRGPFLVHASQGMTTHEYNEVRGFLAEVFPNIRLPIPDHLPRGGIVGQAEITGCVDSSPSRWFFGKYGFQLDRLKSKTIPFVPYSGQLKFFDVPLERLAA
jgi:hypothetical protein